MGAAVSLGLPIDDAYAEVHRSNMSKLERCPACRGDGLHHDGIGVLYENCPTCNGTGRVVLRRGDGKILKGSEYTPPDMEQFVPGIIEGSIAE
jgi:DnaJ-class molecular chaperone